MLPNRMENSKLGSRAMHISISVEFSLGVVVAIALYFLDKSGRSNAIIAFVLLVIMLGLCFHAALSLPWVWSSTNAAMTIWRVAFVICAVVLSVGWFGIWTWPSPFTPTKKNPNVLLASQIQELKALQDFIGGKDEDELWQLFDLQLIMTFNIRRARTSLRPDALSSEEAAEIDAFFKDGKANLDIRYCTLTRTAGGFRYEPIQGKLGILNLSQKHVTNRKTLAKFQSSPKLSHFGQKCG